MAISTINLGKIVENLSSKNSLEVNAVNIDNLETFKGESISLFDNLGSVPPALVVNYSTLYDKYRPLIDMEKGRDKK